MCALQCYGVCERPQLRIISGMYLQNLFSTLTTSVETFLLFYTERHEPFFLVNDRNELADS